MMKQATATPICILVFSLCVLPAVAQGGFTLSQIVRSSTPAPVPQELRAFTATAMNDRGEVVFASDGGVFLRSRGNLKVVAGNGTAAPGGGKFLLTGPPAINSRGQILFQAYTTAPSRSGMFISRNGQITQAVRDQSPNFSGSAFTFETPAINDVGDIAFTADIGIFMKSGSTITRIAALGDPSPDGGTYVFFSGPLINHNKQVVFVALTSIGSGIFASNNGGAAFKIAATGDISPFGQIFFFNFLPAPIAQNDAGQVAFSALTSGTSGVFLWTNGTLTLPVADNTPVGGGGTLFSTNLVSINNTGDIAFEGSVNTDSDQVLLLYSGGVITQLTHTGEVVSGGNTFAACNAPWVNASRQVAFLGHLNESSGGVFVVQSNAQLLRVAEAGDPFNGTPVYVDQSPMAGFNKRGTAGIFALTFPGDYGVFLGTRTGTKLVTHIGDPVPGGAALTSFFGPVLNDNDQIAMLATPSNGIPTLLTGDTNGMARLVTVGDSSPDGGIFTSLLQPAMNNLGQVAFPANTSGGAQSGVFLAANGQITEVFNQHATAPGFGEVGPPQAAGLNDRGQVVFVSAPVSGNTLFLFSQGAFTRVASTGDTAPGGGTFTTFFFNQGDGPFINHRGDVVFGASTSIGQGVYLFSQGQLKRLAGTGDTMPGGGTLTGVLYPAINDAGVVVFTGLIGADFSVFQRTGSVTVRVAGKGDDAPGGGVINTALQPKINARGRIAFSVSLKSGDGAVLVATPNATK